MDTGPSNKWEDARAKMQSIAAVPIRQSALDKAKADAKAKKLRDEKEAASALEDFVKEFDADISDDREWQTGGVEGGMKHSSTQGAGARVSMGAGSRRHFTGAAREVFPCMRVLMGRRSSCHELARRGI